MDELLTMSLEDVLDMEIEIATGVSKPINLAPAIASVITAKQIDQIGATTLDEILETVPSLHVEPSGNGLLSSVWSIRGIHTDNNPHVLLMINSVPFQFNYNGGRPNSFKIAAAMIFRVRHWH